MCVIAIVTSATIMLPVLKLTRSCDVYTFVIVCKYHCYRCSTNVAKANQFLYMYIYIRRRLAFCMFIHRCIYIRNVCICVEHPYYAGYIQCMHWLYKYMLVVIRWWCTVPHLRAVAYRNQLMWMHSIGPLRAGGSITSVVCA